MIYCLLTARYPRYLDHLACSKTGVWALRHVQRQGFEPYGIFTDRVLSLTLKTNIREYRTSSHTHTYTYLLFCLLAARHPRYLNHLACSKTGFWAMFSDLYTWISHLITHTHTYLLFCLLAARHPCYLDHFVCPQARFLNPFWKPVGAVPCLCASRWPFLESARNRICYSLVESARNRICFCLVWNLPEIEYVIVFAILMVISLLLWCLLSLLFCAYYLDYYDAYYPYYSDSTYLYYSDAYYLYFYDVEYLYYSDAFLSSLLWCLLSLLFW